MEDKGAASEKARMSLVYKSLQKTSVAAVRGAWGAVAGDTRERGMEARSHNTFLVIKEGI